MTKTLPTFNVTARLELIVEVKISADDLADSIVRAQELRESDFVKFKGSYIDGSFNVVGVNTEGGWDINRD